MPHTSMLYAASPARIHHQGRLLRMPCHTSQPPPISAGQSERARPAAVGANDYVPGCAPQGRCLEARRASCIARAGRVAQAERAQGPAAAGQQGAPARPANTNSPSVAATWEPARRAAGRGSVWWEASWEPRRCFGEHGPSAVGPRTSTHDTPCTPCRRLVPPLPRSTGFCGSPPPPPPARPHLLRAVAPLRPRRALPCPRPPLLLERRPPHPCLCSCGRWRCHARYVWSRCSGVAPHGCTHVHASATTDERAGSGYAATCSHLQTVIWLLLFEVKCKQYRDLCDSDTLHEIVICTTWTTRSV